MNLDELFQINESLDHSSRFLFHATRSFSALEIFTTDTIKANTTDTARGIHGSGVCLTRSYDFAAKFRRKGVVLVIDATNLNTKPVSYWSPEERSRFDRPDEMEEFLPGSISPLSRYLVSVNSVRPFDEWFSDVRDSLEAFSEFKKPSEIDQLNKMVDGGLREIRAKWNIWKPVHHLRKGK